MEVKKAIKKVLALGAGVSMIGATLLGAMAADLSKYPEPFVQNGMFDALIVVGARASTEDVVGSIDIAQSLQYAVAVPVGGSTATTTVSTVSEGVKIVTSAQSFHYENEIADIRAKITSADMPSVLGDGILELGTTDEDYTQTLEFFSNNARLTFEQDGSDDRVVGDYLRIDRNNLYNYTLKFDGYADLGADTDDCVDALKKSKISIQGRQYTISDVTCQSPDAAAANTSVSKMTLMSGDALMWLQQDQTITMTIDGVEREIMVVDVADSSVGVSCGVSVDGATRWIREDRSDIISGVRIGVSAAKKVHSQLQDTDICELYIGADDLVLEQGKYITKTGSRIDGSIVNFDNQEGTRSGRLKAINVVYKPDQRVHLGLGESWTDPVFGNFKIVFSALEANTEKLSIVGGGSGNGYVDFVNADGDSVEIPFYADGSNVYWGEDADSPLIYKTTPVKCEVVSTTVGPQLTDCEDTLILFAGSDYIPHLLQVYNLREAISGFTNDEIEIKDLTTNKIYKTSDGVTLANDTTILADIGVLGTGVINLKLMNETTHWTIETSSALAEPRTIGEAGLTLGQNAANTGLYLNVTEYRLHDWHENVNESIIPFEITASSDDLTVALGNMSINPHAKRPMSLDRNEKDDAIGITWGGSKIYRYGTGSDASWEVMLVEKPARASVHVTPSEAKVTTTTATGAPVTLTKINVGSAKLDTEVDPKAQNTIMVGGPCANSAAAAWAGVPYATEGCEAGFEAGKGLIKLYESGGKVALLVAGYSATDTRAAARVVGNYKDYKMSGSEAVVTYTDLSHLTVSSPQ